MELSESRLLGNHSKNTSSSSKPKLVDYPQIHFGSAIGSPASSRLEISNSSWCFGLYAL